MNHTPKLKPSPALVRFAKRQLSNGDDRRRSFVPKAIEKELADWGIIEQREIIRGEGSWYFLTAIGWSRDVYQDRDKVVQRLNSIIVADQTGGQDG